MKPPKEPKIFRYPRMYYKSGKFCDRINIIYPNGEWECLYINHDKDLNTNNGWAKTAWKFPPGDGFLRIQQMEDFGNFFNYDSAIFLGEIK